MGFFFLLFSGSLFSQIEVIAHRGASGSSPENTVISIKDALKQGAKYIEIDVHMTSDGHVVAIHDETVDRTTNGHGAVGELTLKEIKKLDAGSFFDSKFKREKIPTLEDVFTHLSNQAVVIIELKSGNEKYKGIEKKIIELVLKYKLEQRVILKSFDVKILKSFKKLNPSISRLYCIIGTFGFMTIDNGLRFRSMLSIEDVTYYQVHKFFLNQSLINKIHKAGKKVIVWDVHEINEIKKFHQMGVDFIESDYPKRVIDIIKQH